MKDSTKNRLAPECDDPRVLALLQNALKACHKHMDATYFSPIMVAQIGYQCAVMFFEEVEELKNKPKGPENTRMGPM